ncbi:MAG: magnesium transporter [Parcubacteria group bacterium Gr01-1014_18]|nr:MAG: magnesium transporter [Parcubacteria group bacterium Greene0416_36]TSC80144.1 MAG: magnesium transporter [Parcubacteria group bacterium Gr01-1014_18]TSC99358.1 MAG: magnesium transporter [Parcubacteria group bacterium Greene1014_20]TSD06805.1 MAG: magnesium transporter [Parcubacteria group bacterium Greene0714_2]
MHSRSMDLGSYSWQHFHNPTHRELAKIASRFELAHEFIRETLTPEQRPKLIFAETYLFMVLLYPVYNAKQGKKLETAEIDFFMGKDFFITIHKGDSAVEDIFSRVNKDKESAKKYLDNPSALLADIVSESLCDCWGILNDLCTALSELSGKILGNDDRKLLSDMLGNKTKITHLKKILHNQHKILSRLGSRSNIFICCARDTENLSDVIDMNRDIWDYLVAYDETVDSFQETYESAATYRQNHILQRLTILSSIVLPATLLASVFSMNMIPDGFLDPVFFWILVGIMVSLGIILFSVYKIKKWL